MPFAVSDELLGTVVPIAVYWLYAGLYIVLDALGVSDKYRLHPKEDEEAKNIASKRTVLKGVLLQQAIQVAVSLVLFKIVGDDGGTVRMQQPRAPVIALQFILAMLVMDTWQYFVHRYMHSNKFLYKHVHAQHHALVVPYAFGTLYSHPLEGLMDTASAAVAFLASGMTPRTSIFFFSFATIKAIDDHCGVWLPGNAMHALFGSNSAYHGIHHQHYGHKFNFAQPFFANWDKLLGTYMPYVLQEREGGGGLETRPVKKHGVAAQGKSD